MSTAYWAKTLEERSGGRIKINLFSSGSLLKGEEAFRGLQNGIADVALYVVNRREGFLLNDVMSLPFMGWPEMKKTHQIYAELLNEFPAMVNEWKGMIIIAGPKMMFPNHLHTTKKEIKVPADIKGMKIMATGITAETVAALGGVPVDIGIADIYMSLDRGLLDGVLNHFAVIDTFGALEKVPYHTVFGDGGMSMNPVMLIMNPDVLHRLPADLQKIVLDCNSVWVNKFYELGDAQLANVYKKANEWGQTFDNLTPQEIKAWYDIVREPVHNKWMRDVEGRGLPGKVVYDRTLELIEEYSAK
jgi:TRAP-type C4-dicarboxylate transport system substrate-binding protein